MSAQDYLTLTNILVAGLALLTTFIGVAFGIFAYIEWRKLKNVRKDMLALEKRLQNEQYQAMKAAHRIIASYALKDTDARIRLLKAALSEYNNAFNAWNALGYAYIEKGDLAKAKAAFEQAITAHPEDKAGYCDLAWLCLISREPDAALAWAKKAIAIDQSARDDLLADARFAKLHAAICAQPGS